MKKYEKYDINKILDSLKKNKGFYLNDKSSFSTTGPFQSFEGAVVIIGPEDNEEYVCPLHSFTEQISLTSVSVSNEKVFEGWCRFGQYGMFDFTNGIEEGIKHYNSKKQRYKITRYIDKNFVETSC